MDMGMESIKLEKTTAVNRICYMFISDHYIREFNRLESVRPVRSRSMYIILFDGDHVSLYNDEDWIEYNGIRYEYRNGGLDRLWMILENENNKRILESL